MQYYTDLFGDVVVTIDDINLWLDLIPRMKGLSNHRRNYYAQNNDVSNKIKAYKLNGKFNELISQHNADKIYDELPLECFSIKYASNNKTIVCPEYFHHCNTESCAIYQRRIKREKSASRYAKSKKAAKRAASVATLN